MKPYDLTELAPNGLRRGYTTGSCATAGVKAALWSYFYGDVLNEVDITLPGGECYLQVAIDSLEKIVGGAVVKVIKDAGDDPDQTHRATIVTKVTVSKEAGIEFRAGEGVGMVKQAGLQIPVGEPAINPVPRQMMEMAIEEVCADLESPPLGFVIEIGCERGKEIAKRTFNPRLGIIGGISILGTSGIVEPKSLAAFKASIAIYINVALSEKAQEVVFSPGNLGQRFAREQLQLQLHQVVQVSNFMGYALDHLKQKLEEEGRRLPLLWIVGHPGKLAKLIDGHWDTHSKCSPAATGIVDRIAGELGISLGGLNTVEQAAVNFADEEKLWQVMAERIHEQVCGRMSSHVEEVRIRLFSMAGHLLNA
ncbi:MAG: cobalt-precorrin-5B (C(1))-methyltransferase CbiD [Verrucomicrobiales bacterium]|nr:cobalt-precorrin-5B (C(1))-methyltransferase CbiD [Verrucomicrobiales bacterium]